MFRRLSSSLPKDPGFPADLEGLGYVIFPSALTYPQWTLTQF